MDSFIRGVAAISRVLGVVAALLIAVSVLVVCHMVFVRYVLGHTTIWQTEFVTYAIIGATLLGSPYVLLKRGHVNVDLVPLWASLKLRWWLHVLSSIITITFVGYITFVGAELWWEAWHLNWHSDTIWRVPLWMPYASLPIGMGFLALQAVADLMSMLTGRSKPFGLPDAVGFEAASELGAVADHGHDVPLTAAAAAPAAINANDKSPRREAGR